MGGDAVAASFNASGDESDTVTFVRDEEAGLISGSFEFTVVDGVSRLNVNGEFTTSISENTAWFCNFDDEVVSICWFSELLGDSEPCLINA